MLSTNYNRFVYYVLFLYNQEMYVKERVLWIKHLFRRIRSIQVRKDFEDMNIGQK
jgi:hypothetical protein